MGYQGTKIKNKICKKMLNAPLIRKKNIFSNKEYLNVIVLVFQIYKRNSVFILYSFRLMLV